MRGAGGAALGLPFLQVMGKGRAQPSSLPQRLVIVMTGQGISITDWVPPGGTGGLSTLPYVLEPLAAHRDRVVVVSGLDNRVRQQLEVGGGGHAPAARTLFTCWPYAEVMNSDGTVPSISEQYARGYAGREIRGAPWGPSIDQIVASRVGRETRLSSLHLRVGGAYVEDNELFFAGSEGRVSAVGGEHRPAQVLSQLTGYADTGEPPPTPDQAGRLRARRSSVLDAVSSDFARLEARLGAADRARLEAHAEFVRDLEHKLGVGVGGGAGCSPHTWNAPGGYNSNHNWDHFTSPAMMDNAALALACDLTRVVTVQFTATHSPTFPFLDVPVPGGWANWHEMVHGNSPGDLSTRHQVFRWYAEQVAYLIERLGSIAEGGGSLLDNTLVVWMSEFGNGAIHSTENIPVILAGNVANRLRTGRHVAYRGRATNDLFTSILHLFGFDDDGFGLRFGGNGSRLSNGPLDGLV